MKKYKNIGLVIVVLVIGFNIYDYFKSKGNIQNDQIAKCSKIFMSTNPDVDKKVADEYCSCVLEKLGEKYKNSSIGVEKILKNEQFIMEDCFDNAKK